MYLIYEQDTNDKIDVLAITHNINDAKTKIAECAKEFIIKKEGSEKLDVVYQENITDDLKDGYYFLKKDDCIVVIEKTSIVSASGWIYSSLTKTINKNKIKEYKFVVFDKSIIPDKLSDEIKNNSLNNMSIVINEIKNNKIPLNNININCDKDICTKNKLLVQEIKEKISHLRKVDNQSKDSDKLNDTRDGILGLCQYDIVELHQYDTSGLHQNKTSDIINDSKEPKDLTN